MDSIKRGVYFMDGKQELKSSLLWDEATDAWKYFSNSPHAVVSGLYRTIPTLYRGISIIENECQNVPFSVFNKSGEEIDNTNDWQNTVGFLPNPRRLFGTVSQSLDRHGQAYLLKEQNRAGIVKSLKWMAQSNIEPIFQPETGELVRFDRTVGSRTIPLQPKEVLYFWLVDSDVEQAPPESWPLRAALQAAGVLHHLDEFMNAYFKSGAIRPMMIMAKGMPATEERERMETWFQKRLMSIKNAFAVKVFNSDTIEAKQIGDGLDQLQNQELTADQRQDVAMALGIPQAILFANSANYATAQSDKKNFYDMTVVPRCELIAEILNDQILTAMGYTIWPSPESLDIYKEDEQARSSSLQQITSAGVPLLMAMDILGYDLTEEQRKELEEAEAKKEEQAELMQEAQLQATEEKPGEKEEVKREFGSDAERRAAFANMAEEEEGGDSRPYSERVQAKENYTDWQGREGKSRERIMGGNMTPGEAEIIELNQNASGAILDRDIKDKTARDTFLSANLMVENKKPMRSALTSYRLTRSGMDIREQYFRVKERIARYGKSLDNPDALAELKRWRRSCHEALRKGKPLPVDWIPEYIPAERVVQIADALKVATDADGIKAAFEEEAIPLPEEWPDLSAQLKRAVDLLEAVRAD